MNTQSQPYNGLTDVGQSQITTIAQGWWMGGISDFLKTPTSINYLKNIY